MSSTSYSLLMAEVAPTLPLSYHVYQLAMIDSFKTSIEYRVAIIGTTTSVSSLQPNIKDKEF